MTDTPSPLRWVLHRKVHPDSRAGDDDGIAFGGERSVSHVYRQGFGQVDGLWFWSMTAWGPDIRRDSGMAGDEATKALARA